MLPGTFDYENVNIGATTRTYFVRVVFAALWIKCEKNHRNSIKKFEYVENE